MNKSLTKPLIRPLGGRWARVCLTALLTAVVTVGAQARATCESGTRACADSLGGAQDRTAVEGGTPSRIAGNIVLTPPATAKIPCSKMPAAWVTTGRVRSTRSTANAAATSASLRAGTTVSATSVTTGSRCGQSAHKSVLPPAGMTQ